MEDKKSLKHSTSTQFQTSKKSIRMLPSPDEIITQRRRLSAEYKVKQELMKHQKENASRSIQKPSLVNTSHTAVGLYHGPQFHKLNYPIQTTTMLESNIGDGNTSETTILENTSGDESTSKSVAKYYSGDEPPQDFYNSSRIDMELPSVEDIITCIRKRRSSSEITYDTQSGKMLMVAEEKEEAPTIELAQTLEAAGCSTIPTSFSPCQRSLDTHPLSDKIHLDQLLQSISGEGKNLPLVDQDGVGKVYIPIHKESQISTQIGKERESPTPELVQALEAAGYCIPLTSANPHRQSLDSHSLPYEIDLDQLLSNISKKDKLPSVNQAEAGKGSLSIHIESQINTHIQKEQDSLTPAKQVQSLVATEVNLLQKSLSNSEFYHSDGVKGRSLFKEEGTSAQLSSNKAFQMWKQKRMTDMIAAQQAPDQRSEHEQQEKNFISVLASRDYSNIGLQKPKSYTKHGLGYHITLVSPPRYRVDLSELYINEVVLIKRDQNFWIFAQVKILTCKGIKAWIPNLQLMVNIPVEIMYTHLRKVEDDEDLKDLPASIAHASLRDKDYGQQQHIPLPVTFDWPRNLRTKGSSKALLKYKQLYFVRPAHLAHRTLHQPLVSTFSCIICLQLMSPMDAHKPWDCKHSCHLFCYQLLIQGTSSNSCNTCSAKKSWDWKIITCQCGFSGFMQKRVDDFEAPPVCPSCCKLSPTLSPYKSSARFGSELMLQSSVPVINSSSNLEELIASPLQGSQTIANIEGCTSLSKLSKNAVYLDELEWRHINCECGLQATIRVSVDLSKLPICPACLNVVQHWTIPQKNVLLKALLGYTPLDSPTSSQTSTSSL